MSSKAARQTEYLIMDLEEKYQVLGFFYFLKLNK